MLTLCEVKQHLRIESDAYDEDDLIQNLIDAGYNFAENYTNQVVAQSVKTLSLDTFPEIIVLPEFPVISVDSIAYKDAGGVDQTFSDYYLNNKELVATIEPIDVFPETDGTRDNILITYTCGFSEIPKTIDQAVLLIVGSLYEQRENHVLGVQINAVPVSAEYLLTPYRVYAT